MRVIRVEPGRLGIATKPADLPPRVLAIEQLPGAISEAEAIEQTQVLTRKYARRQVGWFRRYPQTTWLDSDDPHRVATARQLLWDHA